MVHIPTTYDCRIFIKRYKTKFSVFCKVPYRSDVIDFKTALTIPLSLSLQPFSSPSLTCFNKLIYDNFSFCPTFPITLFLWLLPWSQKLCQKLILTRHLSSSSGFLSSCYTSSSLFSCRSGICILWLICFYISLSSESFISVCNLFINLIFGIFPSSSTFKISCAISYKISTFVLTNSLSIHFLIRSIVHLIIKLLKSLIGYLSNKR